MAATLSQRIAVCDAVTRVMEARARLLFAVSKCPRQRMGVFRTLGRGRAEVEVRRQGGAPPQEDDWCLVEQPWAGGGTV